MDHNIPSNLKYTKEHEWAFLEGDVISIGITDFAQSSLGDIVFVELPEVGTEFNKDAAFGVVESIKSVSDLYLPFGGTIKEKNDDLEESPESINQDAYQSWMIKVHVNDVSEYESLMSSDDYKKFLEENS